MDLEQRINKFNKEITPFYIVDHENGKYSLCLPFTYRFARNFLPNIKKSCRLLSPQEKKKEQIKCRYICTLPAPFPAVS